MPSRRQSAYTVARQLMDAELRKMDACAGHRFGRAWNGAEPVVRCTRCGAPGDEDDLAVEADNAG